MKRHSLLMGALLLAILGLGCKKVPQQWTAEAPCTPQLQQELLIQCQPGQMVKPDHSWIYYWMLLNSGGPGRTHVTYNVYTPAPPQPRYVPSPTTSPSSSSHWWNTPSPTTSRPPAPRTSGGFSSPTPTYHSTPAPTRAPSSSPRTSGGFSSSRPSPRTSGGFSGKR